MKRSRPIAFAALLLACALWSAGFFAHGHDSHGHDHEDAHGGHHHDCVLCCVMHHGAIASAVAIPMAAADIAARSATAPSSRVRPVTTLGIQPTRGPPA